MAFREIKPEELNFNPFQRIGKQWMMREWMEATGRRRGRVQMK